MPSYFRECAFFAINHVNAFTNNIVVRINDTSEQVATYILQVASVGEPLTRRRNMVGGAFAFCFHQHWHP